MLERVNAIHPVFKVAETLEELAPRFPLECVQIVKLLADNQREGWEMFGNDKHFKGILSAAMTSDNPDARTAAYKLTQDFVARGQFDYRVLLA